MTIVEKAEATVQSLEAKRIKCVARGTELQDERNALAFSAHAEGNAKAKSRLEEVHTAIATHASELQSLDAALKAAADRLEKAREAEASASDREAAKELLRELDRFRAIGRELDSALAAVTTQGNALHASLNKMHSLGSAFPTGSQVHSLGYRCLLTAIAATPWRREFETIAPRERRDFSSLIETWAATIESHIAARIEAKQKEKADA